MRIESISKDTLTVAAVVVFLAFGGWNLYRTLTAGPSDVECVVKDKRGNVTSTVRAHPADDRAFDRFIVDAKKRGEICRVIL
ncbi:MAG TPA: hypothetical protein VFR18_00085 [Terriglobia bacterium]|nr:hypothetical protein [Terriglobia bacterium]